MAIESWSQLWDALSGPCALPSWFGRNLDASFLVVRLTARGLFARGNEDGERFLDTTNESDYARADLGDG